MTDRDWIDPYPGPRCEALTSDGHRCHTRMHGHTYAVPNKPERWILCPLHGSLYDRGVTLRSWEGKQLPTGLRRMIPEPFPGRTPQPPLDL